MKSEFEIQISFVRTGFSRIDNCQALDCTLRPSWACLVAMLVCLSYCRISKARQSVKYVWRTDS